MRSMWKDNDMRIAVGRILGGVLCVAGLVVIGLGWNGMARVSCPDCQLPYLISGGAVGLALILLGIGVLLVVEIRAARERLKEQMDRLIEVARVGRAGTAGNGHVEDLDETVVTAKSHE
ncbi:MAG: hypothetical protein ACRDKG_12200 [Actinomycetota bacterium]